MPKFPSRRRKSIEPPPKPWWQAWQRDPPVEPVPYRRRLGRRPAPTPPAESFVERVAERYLMRFPIAVQLRLLWRGVQQERENWLFVLPLLALVGWRTYHQERRIVKAVRERE